MADIDPPSFSLGFEADQEPEFGTESIYHDTPREEPNTNHLVIENSEDEEELPSSWTCDPVQDQGTKIFKRLKRGTVGREESISNGNDAAAEESTGVQDIHHVFGCNGEDEIEDFSSQEDPDTETRRSSHFNSVCSSSKVPLHCSGVVTSHLSNQVSRRNKNHASGPPISSSLEVGYKGLMLPKLTVSPLRRFQLIDSDSDSDSESDERSKGARLEKSVQTPVSLSSSSVYSSIEQARSGKMEKQRSLDLWKDFLPSQSYRVETPVLDEVCDEYFQSLHTNDVTAKQASHNLNRSNSIHGQRIYSEKFTGDKRHLTEHCFPAHVYFFNDDPRVCNLVRSRLPNFFPLSMERNLQPGGTAIDYLGQFNKNSTKQTGNQNTNKLQSSRGRKKSNKLSNVKPAGPSLDPKSSAAVQKAVGRTAQTNTQGGHWYTSNDGKRLYVSRKGQELSGQGAYRCYRKEAGGYKKSKKKAAAKRKRG